MRRYVIAGVVIAAGIASGLVLAFARGGERASGDSTPTRQLPASQPSYVESFQATLDSVRPPGARRIIVHACRAGRVGNEHVCVWTDEHGICRIGWLLEDPSAGTIPERVDACKDV